MVLDKECKIVLLKYDFVLFLNMFFYIFDYFICFKKLKEYIVCKIIFKDFINVIFV